MSEFDDFISKSLSEVIKSNLNSKMEKKIKLDLFLKYGLSIKQGIKNFSKIDEILKKEFKENAASFEKNCLMEIITIKTLKKSALITIKNKNFLNFLIELFGDEEYRNIIKKTLANPLLISEIISQCELPKTSGYRKTSYLIRNGILKSHQREFTAKRRKIERYTPIFKKFIFEINEKQTKINLELPLEVINQSTVIQTINPFLEN